MFSAYYGLTDDQARQIHEAALRVLAEAGVGLDHPKAQEVLSAFGARVSDNKKRVFFPPEFVEKMLARAPREFLCAARDPRNDLVMKLGRSYTRQGGGPILKYDLRDSSSRLLTMADAVESVRLVNALPRINAPSTMSPQDIEVSTYDIATQSKWCWETPKNTSGP